MPALSQPVAGASLSFPLATPSDDIFDAPGGAGTLEPGSIRSEEVEMPRHGSVGSDLDSRQVVDVERGITGLPWSINTATSLGQDTNGLSNCPQAFRPPRMNAFGQVHSVAEHASPEPLTEER